MPNDISLSSFRPVREQRDLSQEDVTRLKSFKNRKLFHFITPYLVLTAILPLAWIYANSRAMRWDAEQIQRIRILSPIFFGALFILLTIYFIRNYIRDIHPYVKDLKRNQKEVLFYKANRYQTPFFREYFLETPLEKTKLIKITGKDYNRIRPGSDVCINYAPNSEFIFSVTIDGLEIK